MTEYKINYWGDSFIYWEHDNTIGISLYSNTKYLSNDELSNYIADSITHEHMHKILHEFLDQLPDFNAKFNLTVSHEILHAVLKKYISGEASSKLDNLTLKYWENDIDINMNYEIK